MPQVILVLQLEGRPGCSAQEIDLAARIAHLRGFIAAQSGGYDTLVGDAGVSLSGGERQRVSIARDVLRRSPLYVYDEATSAQDSVTEQHVLRNLRWTGHAVTTIFIAHRLGMLVEADQILVLDQGEIVERGTHHELIDRQGLYAKLWRAQQHEEGTG